MDGISKFHILRTVRTYLEWSFRQSPIYLRMTPNFFSIDIWWRWCWRRRRWSKTFFSPFVIGDFLLYLFSPSPIWPPFHSPQLLFSFLWLLEEEKGDLWKMVRKGADRAISAGEIAKTKGGGFSSLKDLLLSISPLSKETGSSYPWICCVGRKKEHLLWRRVLRLYCN